MQPAQFAEALRADRWVLVAELQPPDGADLEPLLRSAEKLRGRVDTIQLTDMPRACPHLDNLAATAVLRQRAFDVMVTMTCRDRNLIAQQARLVAAGALGASSVFCITGDPVAVGDHPEAREVFEMRAPAWLSIARRMRDAGCYASGRRAAPAPDVLLGAAMAPGGPHDVVADVVRKVEAGADYFLTQPIFGVEPLLRLESALSGFPRPIVAGIAAPPSLAAARFLDTFPGIDVPLPLIRRMASDENPREAALDGVRATVRTLRDIEGVGGVLVYPVGQPVDWMLDVIGAIETA